MNRAITVVAAIVFLSTCPVYALYTIEDRGTWRETSTKELEELREQSRTLVGPIDPYRHYAIPFAKREAFEAAWPHLLKVKAPGARLVLRRPPGFGLLDGSKGGVCIHTPPEGAPTVKAQNPDGRWEPTYIELIVDGDVVDLNRIPLPNDTPIRDERFKDAATKP